MSEGFSSEGCRHWDQSQEGEADWLSAAILVPRKGLLYYLRYIGDEKEGHRHFDVSKQLFRWRINSTGVKRQIGL